MPSSNKATHPSPKSHEPYYGGFAVVPADATDLTVPARGLFVGGAGNLVVTGADGVDVTFTGVLAGTHLPIRVKRVKATGTTATNIVALY